MRHRTVAELMTPADLVVSARPDTPFKLVAELLSSYGVSGLPVLGPTGRVIGVVTESDLLATLSVGAGYVVQGLLSHAETPVAVVPVVGHGAPR